MFLFSKAHIVFIIPLSLKNSYERSRINPFQVKLHSMFKGILLKNAQSTSLTLLHDGNVVAENEPVTVPPMEIKAYKVKLG